MRNPLRILSIEDDPKDTELIHDMLETAGVVCEVTRVDTEAALLASVDQGGIDLILADYSLPSFDGISALKFALKACPDVPFIFVSGTLGEEVAIEALKIGATDFVLKASLSRLVPSVRRALREATQKAERKQAEEALRQSEAYLAEAQRLSRTGSFGWNVSSGEIYWSEETYKIFEYDRTVQPTLELVFRRIHPNDRDRVQKIIEPASKDRANLDFEHRLLMPDGSVKYVRVLARALEPSPGTFEYVGAVTNITESKLAEKKLRRSEESLLEAQKLSHTGSWRHDVASGAVTVSPEIYRIHDIKPDDDPSNTEFFFRKFHPEDRKRVADLFEKSEIEKTEFQVDYRIVLPDGSIKHLHTIGRPILNESGDLVEFVGTAIDVTERKRAEEERERLRQVQADLAHLSRVTTMGELTASLAHEIRQPIAAAVTNAKTCLRWLGRDAPDVSEAREAASRLVSDVTRAAEIIAGISLLFKKGTTHHELVDVNELIREMIVLLRSEANRYSLSIRTQLAEDLPNVLADRIQLQQVFMNLMLNGIDAMRGMIGAGELTIKSEAGNNQLLISVTDTGVGFLPDQADQIFSAFFTTKEHGIGMGLPISRSIIESHGGRLWAAGASGRGATFHFTLPVTVAAHA
jgi:signal transduction histidine kinase/CheY-like chemotaxis protein